MFTVLLVYEVTRQCSMFQVDIADKKFFFQNIPKTLEFHDRVYTENVGRFLGEDLLLCCSHD